MKNDALNKEAERAISQIFTDTASSSAVGRVFSTYRLVQPALWNEKASKLVFLIKRLKNEKQLFKLKLEFFH